MKKEDIILEKINRNEGDDVVSGKIYNNDDRLRAAIVSAHEKADDNKTAIEEQGKEIGKAKTERKEYVNVSLLNDKYDYTNRTAGRNAVPADIRALGQKITYCIANEGWKTEQFTGTELEEWANPLFWREESIGMVYSLGRSDSVYADVQVFDCGGAADSSDRIIDCAGAENQIK